MLEGDYFSTYSWRGAWLVYKNAKLRIKVKQLASKGMWVLVVVLAGYGSNDNRLRVWEKVDWMVYHTCNISVFGVWAMKNQWLWLSRAITVYILRRNRDIKTVAVVTIFPSSLLPWLSLNWQNHLGRENIFWCRLLGLLYAKRGRWKIAEV